MIRIATFLLAILLAATAQAKTWKVDKNHSHLTFTVDNIGFSITQGQFRSFDAEIEFDPENVETSSVRFTIDAASVDTNSRSREKSITGKNYLDVENFPTITFESTRVRLIDDKSAEIVGNVVLRGTSREVTFIAELVRLAPNPFKKTEDLAGFIVTGVIDRVDFGITYGAPAVGVTIPVRLDLQINPVN